ncbi:divergent PAP2 family protein [Zongyangia hominis]|uniref:Divergent PAP2 family protein n=1 Tax=Zongyangia hominis TaxID=2763677 RepID=A0A926I9W5_9FIRM|nr:divergent PAP2 family protein [Zongyangia hominis]MBC8569596.1 divergent PAP2 family protein [Zongyangia hominis]
MRVLQQLFSNYSLNVALLSWFAAQLLKTIFTMIRTRELVLERLVGSGGMPSSHSATVAGLTVAMARKFGFSSPMFAVAFVLAAIVMYDAMGVRRAAGEQAKVINKIVFDFKKLGNGDAIQFTKEVADDIADEESELEDEDKLLKEFIGHTPLQVLAGALLGILIAILMPLS